MINQLIRAQLKEVPIFKELTPEELEPFVDISQSRLYKQKMLVFMQEDPLDRVFFIQSGKVKIYKTDMHGKEQIISVLEAGEMFPHAGFFRKGGYPAHAEIIEDATLIVTPIDQFEEILIKYPELCIKLFKVLGEKIIDLQKRLEEQILHNTYEQIIMLLLRLCRTNGVKANDRYKLTTHFTNRELANMIGTSRETISRTISILKKKGFVDFTDDGFYLLDHMRLHDEIF
ncbi:Crp/Fnr family transcriptional regulator [Ferdinandcohnia quinoae]|uniref:Crp/Fnr family transcriptional regulator n=1 Tax=Fredinandcohnia quinoae TaxID=2918902 RepID=A0AAW5DZT0_9BACI|nr:Crp/Fnr family transcriptional regulator [Fredinandcohnia sp. SECRCQ15]MCH1625853.1 Crp/Fnr family transcriptional regulator [Fredinandcohnia sp. SECRCQ15]